MKHPSIIAWQDKSGIIERLKNVEIDWAEIKANTVLKIGSKFSPIRLGNFLKCGEAFKMGASRNRAKNLPRELGK